MMTKAAIEGTVAPGFETCHDAFEANLARGEIGAGCAITVGGRLVVDIWGGFADRDRERPWRRDTIVPVFSVSKGVAAVCVLALVARGLIDLNTPVAHYWPEFAQHGKGNVTVAQALGHRAGVPFIDGKIDFAELGDAAQMADRLAAQEPIFEPGKHHIYHPVTIGWITSELVRRVTGRTLGRWFAEQVAAPLDLAMFFGTPVRECERAARLIHRDLEVAIGLEASLTPDSLPWKALTLNGVLSFASGWGERSLDDPAVQALELAGASLLADARSLATFYAACLNEVDGIRLLSDGVIADAIRPVSWGPQFGLEEDGPSWGAGVMTPWSVQPMLGGSSFGHDGMGGSLAFAYPERNVSFAYVRNGHVAGGVQDPQVYAVVDALSAILEKVN
ncbi:beta-lactamase [Sphingobium chlorophenolicum L-1]|uniref:Beta-lactamase n=1 Tax=Sphingobium chlorophenolicum L-1 TaxID=690566 RepID=F6EZP6_SPHCR|nr:serine hydrolase domain-containing protein [Sphingobium chlorophenolicum]AEG50230.1 beta-lactamase [Sphingobium chlorophenolicum L-1]